MASYVKTQATYPLKSEKNLSDLLKKYQDVVEVTPNDIRNPDVSNNLFRNIGIIHLFISSLVGGKSFFLFC